MANNSQLVNDGSPAYGAMSAVMSDHCYSPDPNTQIFTSPCITAHVTTPFDVLVGITACRQPFTLQTGDSVVVGSALAAGARARRIQAKGVRLVIIGLNPFHPQYSLFRRQYGALQLDRERFASFDAELNAAYQGTLSLQASQVLSREVVRQLTQQLPAVPPLDARVQNVMQLLHKNPRLSLEELASCSELSYDRMSHLFIDELGISIRSFQVWVKLHRALRGIRYGQSLIELAQLAGFSDAAHLSRVYKQVYGAPPSYFYYSGNVKQIASFAGAIPGAPEIAKTGEGYRASA